MWSHLEGYHLCQGDPKESFPDAKEQVYHDSKMDFTITIIELTFASVQAYDTLAKVIDYSMLKPYQGRWEVIKGYAWNRL